MNFQRLRFAFRALLVGGCRSEAKEAEDGNIPARMVAAARKAIDADPEVSASIELDQILAGLRSDGVEARKAALEKLTVQRGTDQLSITAGLKALRAAAQPYPFVEPDGAKISEGLVSIVAVAPKPEYIPVVVEVFGGLSGRAKNLALSILANLPDRAAALGIMEIMRQHASEGRVPFLVTASLTQEPRHADVFFPELLQYTKVRNLSFDIYNLCLVYSEAGRIPSDTLAPHAGEILEAYRGFAAKLRPAQRANGVGWMWEESYAEWRSHAALLLDLMGHLPAESVESELKETLDYSDPRLNAFAIISLLRLGSAVDPKHVARVAAEAETRNLLYAALQKLNQLPHYPDRYRTQEGFAESDLVGWLTYPTELGRVPDEIELMKIVSTDTGPPDGIYDYYLFRFRTFAPHWAAKDGWITGVSGPFLRSEEPTIRALGDTFSTFEKWDAKSPDEHVAAIRELMHEWREHYAKQQK